MRSLLRSVLLLHSRCWQCLPLWLAQRVGIAIGWCLEYPVGFRRSVVSGQLAMAFGGRLDAPQLLELRHRVYRHLGLLVVELLRLPGPPGRRLAATLIVEGREHLDAALARGRGVFFLTGHLGNWELPGVWLDAHGYPVAAVGKKMKHPAGDMLRQLLRDENGVRTIARRNSIRQIVGVLKENGILAMMIDQNMTADEGVFVDFFGQPACTMSALATLAARTGAAVIPASSYRDEHLHHHLCLYPELTLDTGATDRRALVLRYTQRFTTCLQTMIEAHPDQWLWIHKRWRTRPPDDHNSVSLPY